MAIQIKGLDSTGGNIADVDSNNNLIVSMGTPTWPTAGGFYTVAGQTSAVVAASLAANTSLMSMRFSAASTRVAYVTRFRVVIAAATVGTAALVAGTIGLQRFTTATPTGGTARTVNRQAEGMGSGSDMTDIRDSNAALTVTSVVFGNVVVSSLVPLFIGAGNMYYEWIIEPTQPIVLRPGDGLALRTQVAMPATQTWVYSYTSHWFEK
jgi:hypothetical protein